MKVFDGPYANSWYRGLFVLHGRYSVDVFISIVEQVDSLPQLIMFVASTKSITAPFGSVRVPLAAPSTNADRCVPFSMLFQSGTVSTSCTVRSIAASAAYIASCACT